ncbi:hypothetical protein GIB67_009428 [Kingdonia uniflora]|uniref:Metallothionein-like protein n=1 Tax=Kingdonia uniflora TaxID=39325 RepID=A0A7J7N2X7_9MAGN|nr:hypothetical protein GIB67_009428 [Kingdonia uniflora]
MSCCGGNCGCGAGCKCGSGCSRCNMYPDLEYFGETTSSRTIIYDLAPLKTYNEASEMVAENGCKYGKDCQCDPCTCK